MRVPLTAAGVAACIALAACSSSSRHQDATGTTRPRRLSTNASERPTPQTERTTVPSTTAPAPVVPSSTTVPATTARPKAASRVLTTRSTTQSTLATAAGPAPSPTGPTLLAAGDIAGCDTTGDTDTAALLDGLAGEIVTLGDNAYDRGTAAEFRDCYGPTWGRHRARTHPAAGNHDYATTNASGYFGYFGASAGPTNRGWYSWDRAGWHLVALNSNCNAIGGCGPGSAQERWLRADLAAHPATCTLAYWHHPRFSSGLHGGSEATSALWQALYEGGADVVLQGHDHDYERFGPADPAGNADPARGIRSWVVGTGGRSHYPLADPLPISEARDGSSFGVLQLTLRQDGYDWRFVPVASSTFSDAGSAACH